MPTKNDDTLPVEAGASEPAQQPYETYVVKLENDHLVSVKARNTEEAIKKAKARDKET